MTPEERKVYNKNYHIENAERVEAYLSRKVRCELCGRNVRYSYLKKHKHTNYCKNHLIVATSEEHI